MGSTLFTPVAPATRAKAEKLLKDFLAELVAACGDRTLVGDAKVYTQQEWIDRGERYGTHGAAVLSMDGSWLYEVFNCYDCGKCAAKWMTRFEGLLKQNGMWYEIGEAWFLYIYED
jgi:hypothetical protein